MEKLKNNLLLFNYIRCIKKNYKINLIKIN